MYRSSQVSPRQRLQGLPEAAPILHPRRDIPRLRRGALPPCGHALRHTREHRRHGGYQFPSLVPPQRVRPPPIRVHGNSGGCQVAAGDREYAEAFLMVSALTLEWVYGMIIYLAVFVVVTGTALKPEVINLLNLVSAVVNRNKDTKVVQTER